VPKSADEMINMNHDDTHEEVHQPIQNSQALKKKIGQNIIILRLFYFGTICQK
jgi:hypothetical protein